jgi:hypothetical protein
MALYSMQQLPGLTTIHDASLYLVNNPKTFSPLDGLVPAVQFTRYTKATAEEVNAELKRIAEKVVIGELPLEVSTPGLENEIAATIQEKDVRIHEALAEGQDWLMNFLRGDYLTIAAQNSYRPGEDYLQISLHKLDISQEGLGIPEDEVTNRLRSLDFSEIQQEAYLIWTAELLLNNGKPVVEREKLEGAIRTFHPTKAEPLIVDFGFELEYPTAQLIRVLPAAYEVLRQGRDIQNSSDFELPATIFSFLSDCTLEERQVYYDFLEREEEKLEKEKRESKEREKRDKMARTRRAGLRLAPPLQ